MDKINWTSDLSVGVDILDRQHQQFIEMLNQCSQKMSNKKISEAETILDKMEIYANDHFSTEEKFFQQCNYEKSVEHINEHNKFKDQYRRFRSDFEKMGSVICYALLEFLVHWLIEHIKNHDRQYTECFKNCGLK